MEKLRIALVGNPNSGKTTLFNELTGANQTVGNWPGVTVEKKEGVLKGHKDVIIADLPGIYSLSPYTLEEVVSRKYIIDEKPDAIINIVDATNIERNLYLTTQAMELGIPVVIALNMMDRVEKSADKIDINALSKKMGCKVVGISALKKTGIKELCEIAIDLAKNAEGQEAIKFSPETEEVITKIENLLSEDVDARIRRWLAIKNFENDKEVAAQTREMLEIIKAYEEKMDDDGESIITDERYTAITTILKDCYQKEKKKMTTSDKIDRIVTNRILALPIFVLIMIGVYFVTVTTIGTIVTDFTNDVLVGEWIQAPISAGLESIGCADWLNGLLVDGIIGGVGAVIGFIPQMIILFFFLAILEDIGYMARVAFIMDRIFRKFGMSGKSFIPMLIGTGCGIPGIMASRTIENQRDRRMSIMTVTFMPCGAKLPIIALIAGAVFNGTWWVAPLAYFIGIAAVVITGIMLKKTRLFAGEAAPFIIELPAYHIPIGRNIGRSIFDRTWAFAKKAFTVILITSVLIWFLTSFGVEGGFHMVEDVSESMLYNIGNAVAFIFAPLGFDQWQSVAATVTGLAAKENIVGTFGVLTSIGDADVATEMVDNVDVAGLAPIAAIFGSKLAAMSFMIFNLLCAPCFAAMSTIGAEMRSKKWTAFAIAYECGFAYLISLIVYQVGRLVQGYGFGVGSVFGIAGIVFLVFMLVRKPSKGVKIETAANAA
ncbi:MAG: ferrous iron transport protein B [Lachnospiraceae bacterium]|nr:ferrous iron transport protein B [Lachnospiraceae bacterium]